MRRFFTVPLLAGFLVFTPLQAADPPVKVFVLAGQSNMEGKAWSAIWFHRIGKAMADAMLEPLRDQP